MLLKSERVEAFAEACIDNGIPVSDKGLAAADTAAQDPHFGFVMDDNLELAGTYIRDQNHRISLEALPAAMQALGTLVRRSGVRYRDMCYAPDPDGSVWQTHVNNAREGKIAVLPKRHQSTKEFGKSQVRVANRTFNQYGSDVQADVAALNYASFRPGTMAGASRVLAETPEKAATSNELEAMPHLSASNWSHGRVVQRAYELMSARSRGSLHLIDLFSGTGATSTAAIYCMAEALQKKMGGGTGLSAERLSLTGFEATPDFVDNIKQDFLPVTQSARASLGLGEAAIVTSGEFSGSPESGKLTIVEGDAVANVLRMDLSDIKPEDLVIVAANYGFHRIPSRRKQVVIRKFADMGLNVLFAIGDLGANGSAVNTGYFNQTNNGIVNTGNLGLHSSLKRAGFLVRTLAMHGYDPGFIDQALRDRAVRDLQNDGFTKYAAKGAAAAKVILP